MLMDTTLRRRLDRDDRELEIIEAGIALAEKTHYRAITARAVAAAAGCSISLIYHYFKDTYALQSCIRDTGTAWGNGAIIEQAHREL